eukprot:TRINITY_DN2368_c0_g4_i1.p2 TRINITY_DN2368_c0_g4~~TRINITY_DN2368_c0_g4_i1.p2  ORF type:complete len:298 (+),score=35.80 TRINITY_DN2368_c0_g4_i1:128-895(+)
MPETSSSNFCGLPNAAVLVLKIFMTVIAFIFWVIAIAGVGAAHNKCKDLAEGCDNRLRLDWFLLTFEFVLLLGMALSSFVFHTLYTCQSLFMILFGILSVLGIVKADEAITYADVFNESQARARAAGWVLLTLVNLVFAMLLAVDWERVGSRINDWQEKRRQQQQQQQELQMQAAVPHETYYVQQPAPSTNYAYNVPPQQVHKAAGDVPPYNAAHQAGTAPAMEAHSGQGPMYTAPVVQAETDQGTSHTPPRNAF